MTTKTNKLSGFKISMWFLALFYTTLIGLGVQHLFTGEELRGEWLLVCLGFIWMIADSIKRREALNEQD
jgi:hypothetical protein